VYWRPDSAVDERQRAEGVAVDDERHDDHRSDSEAPQDAQVLLVAGTRHEHLVGDLRGHDRPARSNDAADRSGRVAVLGVLLLERPDHLDFGGIDVRDAETLQVAVIVDDVHGAPVGRSAARPASRPCAASPRNRASWRARRSPPPEWPPDDSPVPPVRAAALLVVQLRRRDPGGRQVASARAVCTSISANSCGVR